MQCILIVVSASAVQHVVTVGMKWWTEMLQHESLAITTYCVSRTKLVDKGMMCQH